MKNHFYLEAVRDPRRMGTIVRAPYGCLIAYEESIPELIIRMDQSWMNVFEEKWKALDSFFDHYDELVVASD